MTLLLTCLLLCQADVVRDAAEKARAAQRVKINAEIVWGRTSEQETHAPVLVTIDNPGKEIRGTLVFRWGLTAALKGPGEVTPDTLVSAQGLPTIIPMVIPEGARRRHFAYVRGRQPSTTEELWVFLMEDGKLRASFAAPQISRNIGNRVPPRVGIVGSGVLPGLGPTGVDVAFVRTNQLPDHWFGYRPLLAVLWTNADAGSIYDTSQVEALRRWVATGGHLVIARGETAGLRGTFLEEVAPVMIGATVPFENFTGLGALAAGEGL